MIKSGLSETNRARWEKFTPVIWIIAGALIMIPSLLGSRVIREGPSRARKRDKTRMKARTPQKGRLAVGPEGRAPLMRSASLNPRLLHTASGEAQRQSGEGHRI